MSSPVQGTSEFDRIRFFVLLSGRELLVCISEARLRIPLKIKLNTLQRNLFLTFISFNVYSSMYKNFLKFQSYSY